MYRKNDDQFDNDIFLSYNWAHKAYVRKLYEILKYQLNYKVWIDDFELGHTSLTAQLANGIIKSRIFVCCITKNYSESENCKQEFFLAKRKKKPMIILMFEPFDDNIAPDIEMAINTERRFNCYKDMASIESFIEGDNLSQAIKCIRDIIEIENGLDRSETHGSSKYESLDTPFMPMPTPYPTSNSKSHLSTSSSQKFTDSNSRSSSIFPPSTKEQHHIVSIDGTYDGEIKNNQKHGKGKFVFFTGVSYEGDWKNGLQDGFGVETYPNHDRFEGEFVKGIKNGKGVYHHPNGDKLKGKYVNGLLNGVGKYSYANGDVYEGEYFNGVRHGKGTYTFKNGEKKQQSYMGGTLMSPSVFYAYSDGFF